jgi:hypothetical protein
MSCSKLETCVYFKQEHMQQLEGLASLYRGRYCESDHEKCARHRVLSVLGETAVPADMRPNDHSQAQQMVAGTAAAAY